MLEGLASRGRLADVALGVFGTADLPDLVHPVKTADAGEFSLSKLTAFDISVLGRTRIGDPRTDCL